MKREIEMKVETVKQWHGETEIVLTNKMIKTSKLPTPEQKVMVVWEE